MRLLRSERGSMSVELAILAPAFIMIVGLLILAGRVSLAHQNMEEAASQAARAASISRTSQEASNAAQAAAQTYLLNTSMHCQSVDVANSTQGADKAAGVAATVTSTVSCVIQTSDLYLPGLSGTRTVTATASSVVDTYREAH